MNLCKSKVRQLLADFGSVPFMCQVRHHDLDYLRWRARKIRNTTSTNLDMRISCDCQRILQMIAFQSYYRQPYMAKGTSDCDWRWSNKRAHSVSHETPRASWPFTLPPSSVRLNAPPKSISSRAASTSASSIRPDSERCRHEHDVETGARRRPTH